MELVESSELKWYFPFTTSNISDVTTAGVNVWQNVTNFKFIYSTSNLNIPIKISDLYYSLYQHSQYSRRKNGVHFHGLLIAGRHSKTYHSI